MSLLLLPHRGSFCVMAHLACHGNVAQCGIVCFKGNVKCLSAVADLYVLRDGLISYISYCQRASSIRNIE